MFQCNSLNLFRTPTPSSDESLPTLNPWSSSEPGFMRFGLAKDKIVSIDSDYRKTYSSKGLDPNTNWKRFLLSGDLIAIWLYWKWNRNTYLRNKIVLNGFSFYFFCKCYQFYVLYTEFWSRTESCFSDTNIKSDISFLSCILHWFAYSKSFKNRLSGILMLTKNSK